MNVQRCRPPTAIKAHCQPGTNRRRQVEACVCHPQRLQHLLQDPALVVTLDGVGCQDVGQKRKGQRAVMAPGRGRVEAGMQPRMGIVRPQITPSHLLGLSESLPSFISSGGQERNLLHGIGDGQT